MKAYKTLNSRTVPSKELLYSNIFGVSALVWGTFVRPAHSR